MKTMKRMAALLLTLCLLIGLPMAVQATDEFKVVKVVELADNLATSDMPAGRTVVIHLNNTPSADSLAKTGYGLVVNIRIRATGEGLANKDLNGTVVASSGNTITVTFGNTTDNFPKWREAGYDTFKVAIRENNSGTDADKGYIKDFADENGTLLTAPDGTVNKYDEALTLVTQEPFFITKAEELHEKYATADMPAGRTVLVYFNNPPSAESLANTNYNSNINIRVTASKGGVTAEGDPDMNAEIVASYGTNPIAITFGTATNNLNTLREAGYDTFKVYIREKGIGTAADKGWINGFFDTNGVALSNVNSDVVAYEKAEALIGEAVYYAAKIGEVGYATLDEAMAEAAKTGAEIDLLDNVDVTDETVFVLDADVTLDLNGYELSANHVWTFGDIIDSTEGTGKLVVKKDARMSLLQNNSAMPLYDADNECYRFYTYELKEPATGGVKNGTAEKVSFGVQLVFANTEAYDLLANDDTATVNMTLSVTKGDEVYDITTHFSPATLVKYSAAWKAGDTDNNPETNPTLILTVSGLAGVSEISCTPGIYSKTDVCKIMDAPLSYMPTA